MAPNNRCSDENTTQKLLKSKKIIYIKKGDFCGVALIVFTSVYSKSAKLIRCPGGHTRESALTPSHLIKPLTTKSVILG